MLQVQDFFAPVPQALATRLQAAKCILTEDGQWVQPEEAMICPNADISTLLADHRLAGMPTLRYTHHGLTVGFRDAGTLDIPPLSEVL